MEALEICLFTLNDIQHYLNSLLTSSSYDPHKTTLEHLDKLLKLCNEALDSPEINNLDNWNINQKNISLNKERSEKQETVHNQDLQEAKTIVSCDASITVNPDGIAAAGFIIRFDDPNLKLYQQARTLPPTTTTINQAEYDAIYEALKYILTFGLTSLTNKIEIHTDSQLVVKQLYDIWKTNDEHLLRKKESLRNIIQEVGKKYNITVEVIWYPRNSTEDLKQVNYLVQDQLGVKRH